jgi:tetratricopeptide (TPR) repeat protein
MMSVSLRNLTFALVAMAAIGTSCGPADKGTVAVKELPTDSLGPIGVVIDSLTDLMHKRPTDHSLYLKRAEVLLAVGQLNYALADAGRAFLMDSTDFEVHLTLADIYFRMAKPDRTKVYLERARTLAPKEKEPYYRLAEFNLFLQNYQECITNANEALRIEEQDPRPYFLKGIAYKETGDTTRAIDHLMTSLQHNPENVDALVELGIMAYGRKDAKAENYFNNAIRIKPDSKEALYGLGMFYQENDRLNEALATYTRILAIDSTYAMAHYNMGYIHYEYLRSYDEAIKEFSLAYRKNPGYAQAVYMRGLCFEAKGDVSRAAAEYNLALKIDPRYAKAADGAKRVLRK